MNPLTQRPRSLVHRSGGLGLATLGVFLALEHALFRADGLLRGGFLRRNRGALFRNGGGCIGGSCVFGGLFRLISFCGITASRHQSLGFRHKASAFCDLGDGMAMRWLARQIESGCVR